jgi:hypothetical protein
MLLWIWVQVSIQIPGFSSFGYISQKSRIAELINGNFLGFFFFFLVGLMFELRTSLSQSRCSITRATPFSADYFGDGVSRTTWPGWPQTEILPISAFQAARITDVSCSCPALLLSFFSFAILELRAYTLSHSTSPFLLLVFSRQGLTNCLPGLASNHNPPDLCLLSS